MTRQQEMRSGRGLKFDSQAERPVPCAHSCRELSTVLGKGLEVDLRRHFLAPQALAPSAPDAGFPAKACGFRSGSSFASQ